MDRSDPDWSPGMATDDRSLTEPYGPFAAGMIATLRRELGRANEIIASWRRVIEELRTKEHGLTQTIDEQRALIADLERDRDAWRDKAQRTAGPACTTVHTAEWPPFPASALTKGDGIYRGELG
jgi:hypothetical protein